MTYKKTGPMKLPSRIGGGTFDLYLYEFPSGNSYFALSKGEVKGKKDVLFRINSNCVWADIFGSARCDCAEQLHEGLRRIAKEGSGLMIHAYDQDGRGLSLENHVKAYMKQDEGYDTIEADKQIGFSNPDRRNYDEVIAIMRDFEIKSVRMLTNNPHKTESLEKAGIPVKAVPIIAVDIDKFNIAQIYMKKKVLGHDFYDFELDDPEIIKMFEKSRDHDCKSEYDSYLWDC